jgi:hypothetical protein
MSYGRFFVLLFVDRFELLRYVPLQLNSILDSDMSCLNEIIVERRDTLQDNVAQIFFLRDMQQKDVVMCVINCHIFWKPALTKVKLLQVCRVFVCLCVCTTLIHVDILLFW